MVPYETSSSKKLSYSCSYDKIELCLEALVELMKQPRFIVDLYINYDCSLHGFDIFESLSKFLYQVCYLRYWVFLTSSELFSGWRKIVHPPYTCTGGSDVSSSRYCV